MTDPTRLRTVRLLLVGVLLAGTAATIAQPAALPADVRSTGLPFDVDSSFYQPYVGGAGAILTVPGALGRASQLPATEIYLNGMPMVTAAAVPLPIGPGSYPTNIPHYLGQGQTFYPFQNYYSDQYNPLTPLVSEVYDSTSDRVLARTRAVLYDGRPDEGRLLPNRDGPVAAAIGVQLTESGVRALEASHLSLLPRRSFEQFNASYRREIERRVSARTLDISRFTGLSANPNRICVSYGEVAHLLPDTLSAVNSVHADALRQYATYTALKQAFDVRDPKGLLAAALTGGVSLGGLGAAALGAAIEQACVKEPPKLNQDFEVCFETLKGTVTDARLHEVQSAGIELSPNSGELIADPILLGTVEGAADLELLDLTFRYIKPRPACGAPLWPNDLAEEIDDNLVPPAARAWATCPDVEFRARGALNQVPMVSGGADPRPVISTISIDTEDSERIRFRQSSETAFSLIDRGDTTVDRGACAIIEPLQAEAEDMLQSFYGALEAALGPVWDEVLLSASTPWPGLPGGLTPSDPGNTRHAVAKTTLLQTLEVGTYAPVRHDLVWPFSRTGSNDIKDRFGNPLVHGLYGLLDAQAARPANGVRVTNRDPRGGYFFQDNPRAGMPLWPDPADPDGVGYDVAYSMDVVALNQILATRRAIGDLDFVLRVVRSVVPTGVPLPARAELGVRIRPRLSPFVYFHPDPPPRRGSNMPIGDFDHPLVYAIGDAQVELMVRVNPKQPWRVAATFALDIVDPDIRFQFATEAAAELELIPGPTALFALLPLSSDLPRCPISHPVGHQAPVNDCMTELTTALERTLKAPVLQRFYALLDQVPGPQIWDAGGESGAPMRVTHTGFTSTLGVFTVFGRLEPLFDD